MASSVFTAVVILDLSQRRRVSTGLVRHEILSASTRRAPAESRAKKTAWLPRRKAALDQEKLDHVIKNIRERTHGPPRQHRRPDSGFRSRRPAPALPAGARQAAADGRRGAIPRAVWRPGAILRRRPLRRPDLLAPCPRRRDRGGDHRRRVLRDAGGGAAARGGEPAADDRHLDLVVEG